MVDDRTGRAQDALSLRAVPHVHGAVRDTAAMAGDVVDRELASVTDHPIVSGSPDDPVVRSEAHAVAPALAMAERRLDRMLNASVSGLPPFLSVAPGLGSGYMIAHLTAAATRLLTVIDDAERVLGIELPAGADAHDLLDRGDWAPGTRALVAPGPGRGPALR